MIKKHIEKLDSMMKDLAKEEKNGLDTSSLKIFIKNLKMYEKTESLENVEPTSLTNEKNSTTNRLSKWVKVLKNV